MALDPKDIVSDIVEGLKDLVDEGKKAGGTIVGINDSIANLTKVTVKFNQELLKNTKGLKEWVDIHAKSKNNLVNVAKQLTLLKAKLNDYGLSVKQITGFNKLQKQATKGNIVALDKLKRRVSALISDTKATARAEEKVANIRNSALQQLNILHINTRKYNISIRGIIKSLGIKEQLLKGNKVAFASLKNEIKEQISVVKKQTEQDKRIRREKIKLSSSLRKIVVDARLAGVEFKKGGYALELMRKASKGSEVAMIKLRKELGRMKQEAKSASVTIGQLILANLGLNKSQILGVRSHRILGGSLAVLRSKLLVGAFAVGLLQRTVLKLVEAYGVQLEAEQRVRSAIISTGFGAGVTTNELKELAKQIQETTGVSDELVLGSSALLLTFTRVGKEVFPQAQKSIIDMSKAMGIDLKSATIQVGKALQAPKEGLSALTRVGVLFSAEQKETINSMLQFGETADAQKIILSELETQFGGLAEMLSMPAQGRIDAMKSSMGDMSETFGSLLAPTVIEVTENLKEWAESMKPEDIIKMTANILALITAMFTYNKILKAVSITLSITTKGLTKLNKAMLISRGISGGIILGLGYLASKFLESKIAIEESVNSYDLMTASLDKFAQTVKFVLADKGIDSLIKKHRELKEEIRRTENTIHLELQFLNNFLDIGQKITTDEEFEELSEQVIKSADMLGRLHREFDDLSAKEKIVKSFIERFKRFKGVSSEIIKQVIDLAHANDILEKKSELRGLTAGLTQVEKYSDSVISGRKELEKQIIALEKVGVGYDSLDPAVKEEIDRTVELKTNTERLVLEKTNLAKINKDIKVATEDLTTVTSMFTNSTKEQIGFELERNSIERKWQDLLGISRDKIYDYIEKLFQLKEANSILGIKDTTKNLQDQIEVISASNQSLKNEIVLKQKEIELYNMFTESTVESTKAIEDYLEKYKELLELQGKPQALDGLGLTELSSGALTTNQFEAQREQAEQHYQLLTNLYSGNQEALTQIEQAYSDIRTQISANEWSQKLDNAQLYFDQIQETANMYFSSRKSQLDEELSSEIEAEKEKLSYQRASKEQQENMINNIKNKQREERKRIFYGEQALRLAQIGMDTAKGIMTAMAMTPPNPLLAGIISAMGAIQSGIVLSQKPPKYAHGGSFITNGEQQIIVGDNPSGRERVDITPLNSTEGLGSATGGTINVTFTGNVMSQDFIEDEAIPMIKEAIRRGADIGTS